MKRKSKKKLVIIVAVILAALLAFLVAGYFTINKLFSVFSDSFYQSALMMQDPAANEAEVTPEPAGATEEPVSPDKAQQSATPSTVPKAVLPAKEEDDYPFDGLHFSPEQFKAIDAQIPFNEKLAVLNILRKTLGTAEYKELIAMVTGGITSEEIRRAYDILKANIHGDNKKQILAYYHKYSGLVIN
ncbi:MAG: hypothetical protein E7414_04090 [Ruminococcaceae bacterium]|nr:hypothetical protein [Oscillospiraceae bacterium]